VYQAGTPDLLTPSESSLVSMMKVKGFGGYASLDETVDDDLKESGDIENGIQLKSTKKTNR
jgi:hypothetical protein